MVGTRWLQNVFSTDGPATMNSKNFVEALVPSACGFCWALDTSAPTNASVSARIFPYCLKRSSFRRWRRTYSFSVATMSSPSTARSAAGTPLLRRRLLRTAHVALGDEGIVDQIVDPMGGNNLVGNVIEISVPTDEGDAKAFAALVFEADARTVRGNHERNV
jgi:hypothetical protein